MERPANMAIILGNKFKSSFPMTSSVMAPLIFGDTMRMAINTNINITPKSVFHLNSQAILRTRLMLTVVHSPRHFHR